MAENQVVASIERQLMIKRRDYDNIHGTVFGKNGTPDFITSDSTGRYLGIEAKQRNGHVYPNQFRKALKILKSKGRVVVAYEDFDLDKVDTNTLPKHTIEDEFDTSLNKIRSSYELVLK